MNKIIGVVAVLVILWWVFVYMNNSTPDTSIVTPVSASYTDYDVQKLGEKENTVLFFHASWCSKCRSADNAFSKEVFPENLQVMKVDFDNSDELKEKYGVQDKHTFVQVDADGNLLRKWSGSRDLEDVAENLLAAESMEMKEEMDLDTQMTQESDTMENEASMEAETMEEMPMMEEAMNYSGYAEYSEDKIGKAENTVLFFHASWCPTCRAMDKDLQETQIPGNLQVLKIDFDSSDELKEKYGVQEKHTFVQVGENGELLQKWTGGRKLEDITEKL